MHNDEIDLDPDDWQELTDLGQQMVAETFEKLRTVRDRAVWAPPPADVVREIESAALPLDGEPAEAVYADFCRIVEPYVMGNTHPRFWGWVMGGGTAAGVLAEMLMARVNSNTIGAEDAGSHIEASVLNWLKQLLGFPASGSGLLVSSGSMANLIGMTVGRDSRAGFDVIEEGLSGQPPMTVYCSNETHNSVDKAAGMLGLGRRQLRRIPVDADFRIDVARLREAIAADRARGMRPLCIVGNCGTVNTGQVDDLVALHRVAVDEGLWFHVDAAFGAMLQLSPQTRPLARGIELADSVAFDLHKWMNVQFDVACVLVRDAALHRRSFSPPASYLARFERGIAAGSHSYGSLGPDLSRGFRALKVWFMMKTHGVARFAAVVEQNVAHARHAARLIESDPNLELLAPVVTNIVCFRYRPQGCPESELDDLNREILFRVQEEGLAIPSSTRLDGKFAIRMAIVNHRTRFEDFDLFFKRVLEIGAELTRCAAV